MKVLITGASSGIGQALALTYAKRYRQQKRKISIGLLGRNEQALLSVQHQLCAYPNVQSAIYSADVRNFSAMQDVANAYLRRFGTPNVVIASAGVSSATYSDDEADISTFQAVFDINVMGMVHTFQPFIAAMQNQKMPHAQLVGIASVAGVRGLPGASAYSASKSAVITYLESLRIEMAEKQIHVTTIAPGYIRTPMTDINTYPMPFLMPVEKAADAFINAIEAKKNYVVIPWQMGLVARLIKTLPNAVWDFLMRRAPHKPKVEID